MKILITGDFVIDTKYSTKNLSQEIIELFNGSDYNIVNLEAPITDSQIKILKTGPHLKSNMSSAKNVLKKLNVNLVTLANNHIMDYGQKGLLDTLDFCRENNLALVGAGKDKDDAAKIFYLDSPEGKIAIINIAENEWSTATDKIGGANGMDLIDNVKQIQLARAKCNFVIVIVHGGHEYYNLPSPRMQKQYRFYVENGADLVVGHHTHCISGSEIYKGKNIYYSLGNFLFTRPNTNNDWYNGLVLEIQIVNNTIKANHYIISQQKNTYEVIVNDTRNVEQIEMRIKNYNTIISDQDLLLKEWERYIGSRSDSYLNFWSPLSFVRSHYFKAFFRKLNLKVINKLGISYYLNLMRCEAHQDLSKEVLKKYLNK